MSTEAPATPKTKTERQTTAYHILASRPNLPGISGDVDVTSFTPLSTWDIVALDIEAPNGDAAIRKHVEGSRGTGAGQYVAVPARSWKPVTVTVEQTTVVKVGDA